MFTLYKDKTQDRILFSTYSRLMFDIDQMKPIANELIEILRSQIERRSLSGDKWAKTISQLMLGLA